MARPPLRGYNHNIRYRDRVYHVQTEDSGLDNPHVFSHLFFGGVVISTARTDYDDIVGEDGHEPRVQKRMQEQHKSLMKQLRGGDFDSQIIEIFGQLDGESEATGSLAAADSVLDDNQAADALGVDGAALGIEEPVPASIAPPSPSASVSSSSPVMAPPSSPTIASPPSSPAVSASSSSPVIAPPSLPVIAPPSSPAVSASSSSPVIAPPSSPVIAPPSSPAVAPPLPAASASSSSPAVAPPSSPTITSPPSPAMAPPSSPPLSPPPMAPPGAVFDAAATQSDTSLQHAALGVQSEADATLFDVPPVAGGEDSRRSTPVSPSAADAHAANRVLPRSDTAEDVPLGPDLDPGELAAFEQMATTAGSQALAKTGSAPAPSAPVVSGSEATLRGDRGVPSAISEAEITGEFMSTRARGGATSSPMAPPPLPRDSLNMPPLPVSGVTGLPPLPIQEVQVDEELAGSGLSDDTGRYENSLRARGHDDMGGAVDLGGDPSTPDLNFKLKMGRSAGAGSGSGLGSRVSGSAPDVLPNIHLGRTIEDESPDEVLIIDRAEAYERGRTGAYSDVRRASSEHKRSSSHDVRVNPEQLQAPVFDDEPSGVFEKPLPKGARAISPAHSVLPKVPWTQAPPRGKVPVAAPRVPRVPRAPQAPQAPRAPRAPRAPVSVSPRPAPPRVHAVQGSTPQRYTAPSARSRGRGRRATGSYEAVQPPIGGSRPNVRSPSDPAVGRGSSVPHAPSRRGGSAPVAPSIGRHRSSSMRPPSVPSVPAVPLAPPRAPAVVARPAIVVGSRRRSGSGVSLAARGPKVPLAPNRESRGDPVVPLTVPKRASQQTPRARPRSLPNLFGSDLISERSLDEVILHYLSEDSEGKNSEPDS